MFELIEKSEKELLFEMSVELEAESSINVALRYNLETQKVYANLFYEKDGYHFHVASGNISSWLFSELTGYDAKNSEKFS
jgi:hypothetical protein